MMLLVLLQLYVGPSSPEARWITAADRPTICRGFYTSVRQEPEGIGWWTDHPGAEHNFTVRVGEFTKIRVGTPPYVVVKLDDPLLFSCPLLFMSDVGTMGLSEGEVANLQLYFAKGGFLWVDDFWGDKAWDQWVTQIRRVLPHARMIDVTRDHLLLDGVGPIWQMPHVQFWYGNERRTSEREDSERATFKAMLDERDRVMVVSTHNTDIADGWEEQRSEYQEYFNAFTPRAYRLGTNILIYALTH